MKTIEIHNNGPVEDLSIQIPESGGGIVVLRGDNGRGKSMALDAIGMLVGGDGRLSPRDGEERAEINGLGLRIRGGKRTTKKGEPDIRPSITGQDPSLLVDPGIKDPIAADAARVKALLRLAGIELTVVDFMSVVDGLSVDLTEFAGCDDPTKLSSSIKRLIEKAARKAECQASELKGESNGRFVAASEALGSDPTDILSVESPNMAILEGNQRRAADKLATVRAAHKAWLEAENARKKADAELSGIESGEDVAALNARYADARANIARLEGEIAVEIERTTLLTNQIREAIAREDRVSALRAALSSGVAEVSVEDVDDAQAASQKASNRLADAKSVVSARHQMNARVDVLEELEDRQNRAKRLRDAAANVDGVLTRAATSFAGDAWRFRDDRLEYNHEFRGWVPFSELSEGESYSVALEIAMRTEGRGSLFTVRQEAWEGLSPTNRRNLDLLARDVGVVLVTAEATDGPIRSTIFGEV